MSQQLLRLGDEYVRAHMVLPTFLNVRSFQNKNYFLKKILFTYLREGEEQNKEALQDVEDENQ